MPIVVFNQHAFPVKDTVTVRVSASRVTDDEGNEIPFQNIRGEHLNGGDIYVVTFPVEIPAFGYRVYRVFPLTPAEKEFPQLIATEHSLENDLLRVEFDPTSGEISRITDKKSGRIIAEGGMSTIVTDETACDTWAHGYDDLGEVCGNFGNPQFKVVEQGTVCATLCVTTSYNDSTLTRYYTLKAGSDEVGVRCEVDFRECHKALKFTFPAKDSITCEIPYGTVTRELCKGEEPFGKWFTSNGLCVANTNKYGYDSTADTVRMTIQRGAIYADHYGQPYRDSHCHFMDRGPQYFSYTLFAYTTAADAHRRAALLQAPLRAVNDTFHHGPLAERYEGLSGCADNVIITAIKQAEDSDATIVRYLETAGKSGENALHLLDKTINAPTSPYAITTVDEAGNALNFMEWNA
jgi:alpha-mannosidase